MDPKIARSQEPLSTFVATVQLVIAASNRDAANDQIGDLLEGQVGVVDWSYLKLGQQFLYPTPLYKRPEDVLAELAVDEPVVLDLALSVQA